MLIVLCVAAAAFGQPVIPRDTIPRNVRSDVRAQMELLYSEDAVQRALAAQNLGTLGLEAVPAVPFLEKMLQDTVSVQIGPFTTSPAEMARQSLARIGRSAVDSLILSLRSRDVATRWNAVKALGEMRELSAVPALMEALEDRDMRVRNKAAWALRETTGKDFGISAERWRRWWAENRPEDTRGAVYLSGTLHRSAKSFSPYRLVLDGSASSFDLRGEALRQIPDGTRVLVMGVIQTYWYQPPSTESSPFPSQWVIYMDVEKAQVLTGGGQR